MRMFFNFALILFSLQAFGSGDEGRFQTKYDAFYYWLGDDKSLTYTSSIHMPEFTDFDHLAQYAAKKFIDESDWEIHHIANYDWRDNRIEPTKNFIQVAQDGSKLHLVIEGFYFIKKTAPDGTLSKAVFHVYKDYYGRSHLNLYHQDKKAAQAKAMYHSLKEYLVAKNMYRGAVLDSIESPDRKRIYKFLDNVEDYNNVWDDLILKADVKEESFLNTQKFVLNNAALEKIGMSQKKGVLFHGPPGTGKSFVGQILISSMLKGDLKGKSTMFVVSARHMSSVQAVGQLFKVARLLSTSVVFMEDVDLLAIKSRNVNSNQGDSQNKRILNEFLNGMDGVAGNEGVLMIGTTNKAENLDGALTRSGRLGIHIYYGIPAYEERKVFFQRFAVKNTNWSDNLSLEWLAGKTENLSGADIIEIIGIAKQEAFLAGDLTDEKINLNREYFELAIKQVSQTRENAGKERSYKDSLSRLQLVH